MPSTPRAMKRAISVGSLTVQTRTSRPRACASFRAEASKCPYRPDPAAGGPNQARHRAVVVVDIEDGRPRRRAAAPDLHRVEPLTLGREIDGRDFRRDALDVPERPPVERLHARSVRNAGRAQHRDDGRGKGLGIDRFVGRQRAQLGLNREANIVVAGACRQVDDVAQARERPPSTASCAGNRAA